MKEKDIIQGSRIEALIKMLDIKQKDVVDVVETHQSIVSAVVAGKRAVTIEWLEKLANSYLVNPTWILTGEGKPFFTRSNHAPEKIYLGSNVGALMSHDGLSAQELSLRTGLSISIIHAIGSDQAEVSAADLIRLSRVLRISLDDLLSVDLTVPENMQQLEKARENETQMEVVSKKFEQYVKTLEHISDRVDLLDEELKQLKNKPETKEPIS